MTLCIFEFIFCECMCVKLVFVFVKFTFIPPYIVCTSVKSLQWIKSNGIPMIGMAVTEYLELQCNFVSPNEFTGTRPITISLCTVRGSIECKKKQLTFQFTFWLSFFQCAAKNKNNWIQKKKNEKKYHSSNQHGIAYEYKTYLFLRSIFPIIVWMVCLAATSSSTFPSQAKKFVYPFLTVEKRTKPIDISF